MKSVDVDPAFGNKGGEDREGQTGHGVAFAGHDVEGRAIK